MAITIKIDAATLEELRKSDNSFDREVAAALDALSAGQKNPSAPVARLEPLPSRRKRVRGGPVFGL